jgi:hypothetical protein
LIVPVEKNRVKPVAENFSRFARRMIGGHFIAPQKASIHSQMPALTRRACV